MTWEDHGECVVTLRNPSANRSGCARYWVRHAISRSRRCLDR